ncbi:hypothetical protein [Sulfuricurvum sp.]|uniref:hypothetical protein n=1 Tax=Sulfuricurvum sp. TaxID=2025608 RepID=UPI002638BB8A|nr:hypothetical protein [Sulfuricurvum sp.]MDD3597867.1 hypothetical protein [Sulfuricurvum sp.]
MYGINRNGFAMIMAIFVVFLVALGGVLILGNASTGSKTIADNYIRKQAELIALSATEFAVMRAQGFDTTGGNCLNNLNITVQDSAGQAAYDANITIRYSFKNAAPAGCNTLAHTTGNHTMMLIDATVTDHNLSTEPIRVFKRSWQKL